MSPSTGRWRVVGREPVLVGQPDRRQAAFGTVINGADRHRVLVRSQLLGEVVTDLSTLMRQELRAGQAAASRGSKSRRGAALGATAAVAGLLLLICLSLTLIWWLDMAWPLPVAAATVAAIWAVICIVAAVIARAPAAGQPQA